MYVQDQKRCAGLPVWLLSIPLATSVQRSKVFGGGDGTKLALCAPSVLLGTASGSPSERVLRDCFGELPPPCVMTPFNNYFYLTDANKMPIELRICKLIN